MNLKITTKGKEQRCPACDAHWKKSRLFNIICMVAYYGIFALLIYIAFFRPDITAAMCCHECTSLDLLAKNMTQNMTGILTGHF